MLVQSERYNFIIHSTAAKTGTLRGCNVFDFVSRRMQPRWIGRIGACGAIIERPPQCERMRSFM